MILKEYFGDISSSFEHNHSTINFKDLGHLIQLSKNIISRPGQSQGLLYKQPRH